MFPHSNREAKPCPSSHCPHHSWLQVCYCVYGYRWRNSLDSSFSETRTLNISPLKNRLLTCLALCLTAQEANREGPEPLEIYMRRGGPGSFETWCSECSLSPFLRFLWGKQWLQLPCGAFNISVNGSSQVNGSVCPNTSTSPFTQELHSLDGLRRRTFEIC